MYLEQQAIMWVNIKLRQRVVEALITSQEVHHGQESYCRACEEKQGFSNCFVIVYIHMYFI